MNDAELRGEKTKGKKMDIEDEKEDARIGERYGPVELRSSCTEITDAACFTLERKCLAKSTQQGTRTGDRIEKSSSGGSVDCY